MKRYCLTLDLKDDPEVIRQYDLYHQDVWPEVLQSLGDSGIETMRIYRTGNRLIMQLETRDSFSFEEKAKMEAKRVQDSIEASTRMADSLAALEASMMPADSAAVDTAAASTEAAH